MRHEEGRNDGKGNELGGRNAKRRKNGNIAANALQALQCDAFRSLLGYIRQAIKRKGQAELDQLRRVGANSQKGKGREGGFRESGRNRGISEKGGEQVEQREYPRGFGKRGIDTFLQTLSRM